MARVAGPYRDFWIMLTMIGVAVFAANATSKPGTVSPVPASLPTASRNQIVTAPVSSPTLTQEKVLPAPQTSVATATAASADSLSPTSSSTGNATSVSETAPSAPMAAPQSTATSSAITITEPITSTASEPNPEVFDGLIASIEQSQATTVAAVDPSKTAGPISAAKFAYMRVPLELRDGPSPKYIVVGSLGQNALVSVMEQEAGWTHVSGGPDAIGWVPSGTISSSSVLNVARKSVPNMRIVETPRREGGR
ncbi:hypothetical protein NXC24_PB00351 (plasmid) [Rhizobium sp. NXC24]|nr:hypothetical protein NXC24_PB00351 [Rhizobium sp. NXC24]